MIERLGASETCKWIFEIAVALPIVADTLGLSPATLRKWGNGEREATGAPRILLTIISREPEATLRAIR